MTNIQLGLIVSAIYIAHGLEDRKFSSILGMFMLIFTCIVALFQK